MLRDREPPAQGKYLPGGDLLHDREGAPPEMGIEVNDLPNNAETDVAGEPRGDGDGGPNWLQLARDAYSFSTTYVDSNYRKKWEDSIRAFNSEHPLDSKYASPSYSKRSNIYRPKTRSIIRKNEAAASAAFFSNPDVITAEPTNQSDQKQLAAASVMKELIHFRLDKSIPWYLTVLGGVQDAQTIGVVCSHQYWKYEERDGRVIADKPAIDLIPVENIRIDPASDWRDPIESSPYVIHLIPMYIGDVLAKMETVDPKTGAPEWKKVSVGILQTSSEAKQDSTRMTRNRGQSDPNSEDGQPVSDYAICWVQRHIHRRDGEDWTFYTVGDTALLTEPVPLREVVHHGKRPYVMGSAIIETHKIMPAGIPEISKAVQSEMNDTANAAMDNQYFVLNKRWIVKRGQNTDLPGLVRNVAGNIILTNDPEKDVKEINWPEVNQGIYQQQDRLTADFSSLVGDFDANNAQVARRGQEPAKLLSLQAASPQPLTEYLLRTIVTTWLEKVLRQIVLLEQKYETDQTVLAVVGQRAKLFEKFGMNQVTDELLKQELTIRVNVGLGATDPFQKLQKFLLGLNNFKEFAKEAPPGSNLGEVWKEIAGHLGYQDGARFFGDASPEVQKLRAQLQHAGQVIQELGKRHEDKSREVEAKEKIAHEGNVTTLVTAAMSHDPVLAHAVVAQLAPGQGFKATPAPFLPEIAKQAMQTKEKKEKEAKADAEKPMNAVKEMVASHQQVAQANAQQMAQIVKAMMQAVQAMLDASQANAQATAQLAQALTAPKVKETKAVRDARGGFSLTTTEHMATQQ